MGSVQARHGPWVALLAALAMTGAAPAQDAPAGTEEKKAQTADKTPADDDTVVAALKTRLDGHEPYTSLRATFRQTKTTPVLRRPIESSGTVLVMEKTSLWKTTKPSVMTMRVCPEDVRFYYPDDRLLEIYELPAYAASLAIGPSVDLAALRESFALQRDEELQGDHDASKKLAVRLVPKAQALREAAGEVSVLVDLEQRIAVEMVSRDASGAMTRTTFENVRTDAPMEASDLEIDTADDVEVERIRPPGSGGGSGEAGAP